MSCFKVHQPYCDPEIFNLTIYLYIKKCGRPYKFYFSHPVHQKPNLFFGLKINVGSGALADCGDGNSNKIKCCPTSARISTGCMVEAARESGSLLSCFFNQVVTSYCGTTMYRECWAKSKGSFYCFIVTLN